MFIASFSANQTAGQPSQINFTDTSTGSDGAITQRRIYIAQSNGIFLVQQGTVTQYENWAWPGLTTTLTLLSKDISALITVQWLDVSGNILYAYAANYGLTLFNETFDYQLTQNVSGNPLLLEDNGFFEEKSKLRVAIDSGNQCVVLGDLTGAQNCYDIATNIRINSQYLFNANA